MVQPAVDIRKAPRVTVVTPTFNRADLLPLTARSVLEQTFRDFEYLILDDGSTDHTEAVVRQFQDPRVAYFRHENRGEAATTNRGWAMARGDYFAILSSDDLVKPQWLERLVRYLDEHPEVLVAYPDYDIVDRAGNVTGVAITPEYDRDRMIASFHPFPGVGAVIRRSALTDLRRVRDPGYRFAPDLDSWLRLSLRGDFARVPEILGGWRSHEGSITVADRSRARLREMLCISQAFFALPDLPAEVRRLRPFALAQAHYLVFWIARDMRPLRAAWHLRRSYDISPVQPDFIPPFLARAPRPGNRELLRLFARSLRYRCVAGLRFVVRRMPLGIRKAGRAVLVRLRVVPRLPAEPTGPVLPPAEPVAPPPEPAPDLTPEPVSDPARKRLEALMPQIREDLAAFRDTVGVLSPTPTLLDAVLRHAITPAAPAIAQVTGRVLAALPTDIDHLLVLPWVHGIGGSETVSERLIEALRRLRGDEGLCVLAPDESYRPAGLRRHRGLPFLGLSDFEASLDAAARAEIFDRIMVQRRPRVMHGVNSRTAWQAVSERGRWYAADSALFANIYSDIRLSDGTPAATYYYDNLPHCIDHLTGVIADNRTILRRAEASFGLGDALRAKLHVVRTPVIGLDGGDPTRDLRPFRPSPERRSLWLSRLATEKRLDVLADLAARCPDRHFDVRGGDNGYLPDLSALRSRPNVAILGRFGSLGDIPWNDYDSYVFTTSGEGMPIAILEIAARGLPVIAPAVGGIGEFVNADTGWLIPSQGVGDYADALAQIESEPEEAARRVAAAQALLLEAYSRDAFDSALRGIPGYLGDPP